MAQVDKNLKVNPPVPVNPPVVQPPKEAPKKIINEQVNNVAQVALNPQDPQAVPPKKEIVAVVEKQQEPQKEEPKPVIVEKKEIPQKNENVAVVEKQEKPKLTDKQLAQIAQGRRHLSDAPQTSKADADKLKGIFAKVSKKYAEKSDRDEAIKTAVREAKAVFGVDAQVQAQIEAYLMTKDGDQFKKTVEKLETGTFKSLDQKRAAKEKKQLYIQKQNELVAALANLEKEIQKIDVGGTEEELKKLAELQKQFEVLKKLQNEIKENLAPKDEAKKDDVQPPKPAEVKNDGIQPPKGEPKKVDVQPPKVEPKKAEEPAKVEPKKVDVQPPKGEPKKAEGQPPKVEPKKVDPAVVPPVVVPPKKEVINDPFSGEDLEMQRAIAMSLEKQENNADQPKVDNPPKAVNKPVENKPKVVNQPVENQPKVVNPPKKTTPVVGKKPGVIQPAQKEQVKKAQPNEVEKGKKEPSALSKFGKFLATPFVALGTLIKNCFNYFFKKNDGRKLKD